jgi:integrase
MAEAGYKRIEKGIFTREGRWYIRFEKDGRTVKEVTNATNLTEARKARAVAVGKVAEDKHVSRTKRRVTIGELLDGLLASWRTRKVASLASASCQLEIVRQEFGSMAARDLRKSRMQDYIDAGANPAERSTRSSRIAIIRAAMRRALEDETIDRVPSFPKRIKNVRTGYLRPEQFEEQVAKFEGVEADALRTLYMSGQRRQRILELRDTDVDTERWVVMAQVPRGNKLRPEIRLRGELRRIIEARLRAVVAPGGLLFHDEGRPISGGAISQKWKRCMRQQGLKWVLHDLRRSASVNLRNSGADTLIAERIIGHTVNSIISDYLPLDALEEAMDKAIDARDAYVALRLQSTGWTKTDHNPDHAAVPQEVAR